MTTCRHELVVLCHPEPWQNFPLTSCWNYQTIFPFGRVFSLYNNRDEDSNNDSHHQALCTQESIHFPHVSGSVISSLINTIEVSTAPWGRPMTNMSTVSPLLSFSILLLQTRRYTAAHWPYTQAWPATMVSICSTPWNESVDVPLSSPYYYHSIYSRHQGRFITLIDPPYWEVPFRTTHAEVPKEAERKRYYCTNW